MIITHHKFSKWIWPRLSLVSYRFFPSSSGFRMFLLGKYVKNSEEIHKTPEHQKRCTAWRKRSENSFSFQPNFNFNLITKGHRFFRKVFFYSCTSFVVFGRDRLFLDEFFFSHMHMVLKVKKKSLGKSFQTFKKIS